MTVVKDLLFECNYLTFVELSSKLIVTFLSNWHKLTPSTEVHCLASYSGIFPYSVPTATHNTLTMT